VAIDRGDDVVAGAFEEDLPHPQADDFIVNAQNQMSFILHVPGLSGAKRATSTEYTRRRSPIAGRRLTQIIHRTFAKQGAGVS
jgi:hypothetical protein